MEEGGDDDLTIKLIAAAVCAGDYRVRARGAGGGGNHFQVMADGISGKVAALAGEICERDARGCGPDPR